MTLNKLLASIGLVLHGCVCIAADVQLRITVWEGDNALRAVRQSVADFESAHPGIRVKVEPVAYGNYQDKLLTQVAANVAPDVAMMDPGNFQRYARRNALLNLNELISASPDFQLSEYYKPIIDACTLDGNLYVLPRDIAPIGLVYYNKSLFDQAKIPYPDGSWTWDFRERPELREKDFLWVIHQLSKQDSKGKPVRYGYAPGWPAALGDLMVYSQGARYMDDPANPKKLFFDDPRVVNAYQLVQDLGFKKRWIPSQVELTTSLMSGVGDLFVQGKVAMFQSGIWEVPNLRKKLVPGSPNFFEWDIALMPAYKDGTRAMSTGGSGYCILKQSKHPREAWELLKWMAGPPGMTALAKTGLAQPAIRALARSSPWIPGKDVPREERYPASRILTDVAVDSVVFDPTSDRWADIKSVITPSIDRIWMGQLTAEQGLKEAQNAGTARLDFLEKQSEAPQFPWTMGLGMGLLFLGGAVGWVYWPERKIRRTDKEKKESRTAYLFLAPWLIGLVVFTIGPMMLSFLMSFSDWDIIMPAKWHGFGNYSEALWSDPRFYNSLRVTFVYTLVSVPLGIILSLLLALLLNTKVRGMPLYRTLFYLPSLTSGVAIALIWKSVFKADGGLLNSIIYGPKGDSNFLGLASLLAPLGNPGEQVNWLGNEKTALGALIMMSVWGAGAGMVVLLAGLQGVPEYYYEAAKVDGAGSIKRFWNITLPMISPAILFSLVTGIIGSFQVFTQAFVMTAGGPGDSTLFYMLNLYNQAFVNLRMGYASALAWILFLIILVFTLLQLKLSKWVYYEAESR